MRLEEAIKDFLVECEIRRYTKKTLRGYRTNLNVFRRVCEEELGVTDIESVTVATVRQFTQVMTKCGHKSTYINSLIKTAKSFIQYCFEEGYGGFNTKLKSFRWVKEDKLENFVLDTEERREQLVQDWEQLQAQISDKRQEMTVLQDRVKKLREVDRRLGPLVDSVLDLLRAP